jgi:putative ABC transport system permease protein
MKIPLALLQLTHEKIRLLVAVCGISFAVILMFMQLGFRTALFDGAVRMHNSFHADMILISPRSNAIVSMQSFSVRRLYQALEVPGVESVSPLYFDFGQWRSLESFDTRGIFIIGFNPHEPVFNLSAIQSKAHRLYQSDWVLFDEASRPEYGPVTEQYKQGKMITTEVGNRRIRVAGLFQMGTSFAVNGTLITSDQNFWRFFPKRRRGLIDLGLIRLKSATNKEIALAQLCAALPGDVKVLTKAAYMEMEKDYWNRSTAIGYIFALGAAMGFVVGTIIVYQILYTDVSNHLAEYATLKAIGYTNFYLIGVVFQEALLLAILGFIPGFAISTFLYEQTRSATLLPIAMETTRTMLILILTVAMCFVSGAIAIRKLQAADPADIF